MIDPNSTLGARWADSSLQNGDCALVLGASGAIGAAVLQGLAARFPALTLIAHSRTPRQSPEESTHMHRVSWLHADLRHEDQIQLLARDVQAKIRADGLNLRLVFNASGWLHDEKHQPEKTITQLSAAGLISSFSLNAFAPALLAGALWQQLKPAGLRVFASLSARVGSIGDNRLGGWYSYRAAKAAQNQLLRCLAIEWRRSNRASIAVALHPGTVESELSAPFRGGSSSSKRFSPEQAAGYLLDIVLALQPSDSGRFIAWDGQDIPW